MRHVRTLIRVMTRPRDLFEGGLLGAVPVGASRAPRAGIVLTNDPSADAVRVYDRASNGKLQSAASTPRMVLLAAHSGAPADGQGTPQEAGRPGSGCRAACSRRQEMQVAGIRRVGARVEMIEVGEPRRLASDEALLEVRAAGVASWDEFVRTGGWDVGGRPPMALGVEAVGTVLAADQAVGDWAPGDAVMTHPVPLRDQGTLGACAVPKLVHSRSPGTSRTLCHPAILADQAADGLPALDTCGQIDGAVGQVQWRSLL